MTDDRKKIPDLAPIKNLIWYFDAQVFASYRNEPHKYALRDDYFEGKLVATEIFYQEQVEKSAEHGSIEVLFGYRTLKTGELAVAAWFPHLDKMPEAHKKRWDGFRLNQPQWIDYEDDTRFKLWVSRYVNGSWDVEMGILSKLRSLVHLINGLTEEGVGVPLFKHEDSSNLHFPAAENTSRYEDAHRELYGYLVDGLNKECITKLGTHVGSPINSANLKTLDALKKVLPVLKSSTLFTSVFDKLSAKRGSASHGVRGPATRYSAFDEFANDLTGYVSALEELREELEKTLGMAAEKATRRHERKGYLPKLDQSRPIHSNYAIAQAPLMQGKTVDHVEFGFRRSIEGVHESEALIIYFTDGSILGMDTGSNVANVIADHKGTSLKEEDFHVDLNLWWVPSAR